MYFGLFFQFGAAQYISVDEGYSAQNLVENVLINSPCANVFNITSSGGAFSSGEKSYGFFDAVGTGFPFENGIILSTGKINNAPGPNTSLSDDGGNMGWTGDVDLNQALGLSNTFNATILEFDFIPQGDHISFDYIFSSEQYLTNPSANQCNYTDGFAFLLKEASSTTYDNLAVVPGTSTPVKVNTVRGPGTICPPANATYFDAFNTANHPTNYNGQTVVLTAQATVIPGTTYHIKLVIADEGNYRFDSAIFLGGGSFDFGVTLGEDRLIANGNPLCPGESFTVDAAQTGAIGYQWYRNNSLLQGATNATYTITMPGTYSVAINYGGSCETTGTITIEYAADLSINQNTFPLCDADANQDGITDFDLSTLLPNLFTNLPSNYSISFFETPSSTTSLPLNYTNTTPYNQTIYARIMNVQGCYSDYPIYLTVNTFSTPLTDVTIGLCQDNPTTLQADGGFVSYTWNTIPIQTTPTITVSSAGTYEVTITNALGCSKTKTFTVSASGLATINSILINDFSEENSLTVDYSGAGVYAFSLDGINYQSTPTFDHLTEGMYTVYINDTKGCGEITSIVYVLNYPKYFTPNGDGFNDTWRINNLKKRGLEGSTITVFDRYGKLITQLASEGAGWDGTFNGTDLPSSDYWFTLELTSGKTIKGHFTLKR